MTEAKAEIETQPVKVEAKKVGVQYNSRFLLFMLFTY